MVSDSVQQMSFSTQFREFYVNPVTGSDAADGTAANPYQTLTHALQQVSSSTAIIRLDAGLYSTATGEVFPLVVPPQTSVLGNVRPQKGKNRSAAETVQTNVQTNIQAAASEPHVVIRGGGAYTSPTFEEQNVAIVLQDNALLRDLTITNPNLKGTGVWVEDVPAAITNCQILDCGREGILVTGIANPVITDCTLQNNTASGITFMRHARGEIRRSVCTGSRFGVVIGDEASPFMLDNQFVGNRSGVVLSGMARPVLRNNRIVENQEDGLAIFQQAEPDLGQPSDPGCNVFEQNGTALRNATTKPLESVGNHLSFLGLQGAIELLPSQVSSPLNRSLKSAAPIRKRHSLTTKLHPVTPPFAVPFVLASHSSAFADIQDHWADAFISALVAHTSIEAASTEPFFPDAPISRAQFAVWAAQVFSSAVAPSPLRSTQGLSDIPFSDIPSDHWAVDAIAQAKRMGFAIAFADQTFRPEERLTRIQAILALVNGLGLKGTNPDRLVLYRDRVQIPSYALPAVAAAIQNRLVVHAALNSASMPHDRLFPLVSLTRAEAAVMLYQGLILLKQVQPIASPHLVQPPEWVVAFPDSNDHWATHFIQGAVSQGILSGLPNGQFAPDRPMTRAEFAAVLVCLFEPEAERPAKPFSDVAESDVAESDLLEAKKAIDRVYQSKLMGGFADGTFRPNQPITRIQALLSLVSGLKCPTTNLELLERFTDHETIPTSARPALTAAIAHWLVVNYPRLTQLQPHSPATRAEIAAMVYQALVQMGRSVPLSSPYIIDPRYPDQPKRLKAPILVVLDPGHGGLDFGMVSTTRPQPARPQPDRSQPNRFQMREFPPEMGLPGPSPFSIPPGQAQIPGQPPAMPPSGFSPSEFPFPGLASLGSMPPIPLTQEPALREKDVVLPIAQQISQHLAMAGIQVLFTRSDDRYLDLAARANLVHQSNADFLISIHANGAPNQPEINGLEIYYSSDTTDPNVAESSQLAYTLHRTILESLDLSDRGVRSSNFQLLRLSSIPAAHIEIGYLTGKTDAHNLTNPNYCTQLAKAIANGILQHIQQLV